MTDHTALLRAADQLVEHRDALRSRWGASISPVAAGRLSGLEEAASMVRELAATTGGDSGASRPTVVVLCGSTRFGDAFREANLRRTLAGDIVLSIGCDLRSDHELWSDKTPEEVARIKAGLDELHKRKIDLADEVHVLNVGGYIGESTRSEIAYAEKLGRPITYLEATP